MTSNNTTEVIGDGGYPARFVEFFGPSMWKTLHAITFTYPHNPTDKDKENYRNFFYSVGPVVPCPECSNHFQQHLTATPPRLESRESLSKWLYNIHDLVNRTNNKKSPTFEQVQGMYNNWTKADNEAFGNLNTRYKLKRMADPHFNKLPGAKSESPMDDLTNRNIAGILVICAIILAIIIIAYIWWKRNQEYKSKLSKIE